MKKILLSLTVLSVVTVLISSCANQTCPTYATETPTEEASDIKS